jgi:hypothetical protein
MQYKRVKAGHNAKSPVLLARYTSKTRRSAQENHVATQPTVKLGVIFPITRTELSIRNDTRVRERVASGRVLPRCLNSWKQTQDYRALSVAIALP